jgi:hypothetical protein
VRLPEGRGVTRLTFTEGGFGRTYWLASPDTGKRRRVPSVSALKNTLHAFGGEGWYLQQAAQAAALAWDDIAAAAPTMREQMILHEATRRVRWPAEFGTAVHHYAEQLWTGEPIDVPEEYLGHVRSVADWWNGEQVALVAAERMVWADDDDLGAGPCAGRLDLIVKHPDRGTGLLDLKTWTSRSAGSPRLEEWAFQLTAYAQMDYIVIDEDDQDMPTIDWVGVLHVGPPGAVLYTLPDRDRQIAADQVLCARSLKALPRPKMVTA